MDGSLSGYDISHGVCVIIRWMFHHCCTSQTALHLDDGIAILSTSEFSKGCQILTAEAMVFVAGGRVRSSHWLLLRVVLHAMRWP